MDLSTSILFFFSSLGVFNGLLMSLYFLLWASKKQMSNVYFGLLLLMLSMRIGKSVLLFFGANFSKTFLQVGLSACFFVGPFLFLYTRSVLRREVKIDRKDMVHLLVLLSIILTIGIAFPYERRPDLWNPEIVQFIYAIWILYIMATGYLLRKVIWEVMIKPKETPPSNKWLVIVFGTNVLICLVFNSVLYFGFPSYILGPITFSFVFYGLLAFLLFFPKSKTIVEGEKQSYANKKILNDQASEVIRNLEELMKKEEVFKKPDLKLKDVSALLDISPHTLSQILNDNIGKNFSELINNYRIEAASKILGTNHNLTIEGIGNEVGFRSKSSFYAAFKKVYGMTPTQYAKQALS